MFQEVRVPGDLRVRPEKGLVLRPLVGLCLALFLCYPAFSQKQDPSDVLFIDLAGDQHRQVVVDQEEGQYLGHPSTVLLEDGQTIIAVYPKGHGRGAIVMKKSRDGGLSWSERISTPENWQTSQETPTIYRVVGPRGLKRLLLFSGLYPIRMAVSEGDGNHWSPLQPIGDYGGIVAMSSLERLKDGRHMALFHDDGRFLNGLGQRREPMTVYKVLSSDGGLTWGSPIEIARHARANLCEPGLIRSPGGEEMAVLLRENTRSFNSFVIFSRDEGETWSEPVEVSDVLTGDRHVARYAPDGRLFITFRDMSARSSTRGDWVGWVGHYRDIVRGNAGQYKVRLMDNLYKSDCGYAGLEILENGTFVTTSYGHWQADSEPYIVSVRFNLAELDDLATARSTEP